jgi:hypothetical protein
MLVDLVLGDTAVSEQFNAVDVTAVVGGEEYRNFAHIIRRTQATERHIRCCARLPRVSAM